MNKTEDYLRLVRLLGNIVFTRTNVSENDARAIADSILYRLNQIRVDDKISIDILLLRNYVTNNND